MPVTITVRQLAVEVRVTTSETATIPGGQEAVLTRLLAVATEAVTRYAPSAPNAVLDEAAIRVCGFLFDMDPAEGRRVTDPLRLSGAASLLSPWRVRRIVTGGTGANDAVR